MAGDKAGSKLQKAQQHGVKVINEAEFMAILIKIVCIIAPVFYDYLCTN
jgi:BRCT domain type II-containing protein